MSERRLTCGHLVEQAVLYANRSPSGSAQSCPSCGHTRGGVDSTKIVDVLLRAREADRAIASHHMSALACLHTPSYALGARRLSGRMLFGAAASAGTGDHGRAGDCVTGISKISLTRRFQMTSRGEYLSHWSGVHPERRICCFAPPPVCHLRTTEESLWKA